MVYFENSNLRYADLLNNYLVIVIVYAKDKKLAIVVVYIKLRTVAHIIVQIIKNFKLKLNTNLFLFFFFFAIYKLIF